MEWLDKWLSYLWLCHVCIDSCSSMVIVDDEKDHKSRTEHGIKEWLDAVFQCSTLSRLNVLVGILESCVKWEKSAENAVGSSFDCHRKTFCAGLG